MQNLSNMLCEYAFNENHELVHIDDVDNGCNCNCTCPCCGEKMIARNGGKIREHHFAHSSGTDCIGYKETLLHIWSKQIIEEYKTFTIPQYKSVSKQILIKSKKLKFSSVEIEQRNDTKLLQPDIVGVTDDGLRLWIEIFVTHKCGEEKIQYIKENGYNCIEVKIPEGIETKEDLSEFLVNSDDFNLKYFINYPYGDLLLEDFEVYKNKPIDNFNYFSDEIETNEIQYSNPINENKCVDCFKNIVMQDFYSNLLKEYEPILKNDFNYIFKIKELKYLVEKYPKLAYLGNAIIHQRFNKYSKYYKMTECDFNILLDFCAKLQYAMKRYNDPDFYHWYCENRPDNGGKCTLCNL